LATSATPTRDDFAAMLNESLGGEDQGFEGRVVTGTVTAIALILAALGVVFGDIGTSPLYALQTVFSSDHQAVKPTEGDVFGVISLVFWSITLIVSVEFVLFIMRADNDGEGGILALIAKIMGAPLRSGKVKATLIGLGMFGVASFTAIINPPQAAILSVGSLQPRAVVRDGEIIARNTMTVTLACDHRILYGADAARFLARIRELLETPAALTL